MTKPLNAHHDPRPLHSWLAPAGPPRPRLRCALPTKLDVPLFTLLVESACYSACLPKGQLSYSHTSYSGGSTSGMKNALALCELSDKELPYTYLQVWTPGGPRKTGLVALRSGPTSFVAVAAATVSNTAVAVAVAECAGAPLLVHLRRHVFDAVSPALPAPQSMAHAEDATVTTRTSEDPSMPGATHDASRTPRGRDGAPPAAACSGAFHEALRRHMMKEAHPTEHRGPCAALAPPQHRLVPLARPLEIASPAPRDRISLEIASP